MKSHRLLRKRERSNKRNKRRKKTLKKLKGGGLIEDTSSTKWLVCDNPYCWMNHYKNQSNDILKFVKDTGQYETDSNFIIKILDRTKWTGFQTRHFFILKKKSRGKNNYFYIGDVFTKVRDGTIKKSDNPRYEPMDSMYQNIDLLKASRTAKRIEADSRDITRIKKNIDGWNLEEIEDWENVLIESILGLIQTIDIKEDEKNNNGDTCYSDLIDIENILHLINSKGRRIQKITGDTSSYSNWTGLIKKEDKLELIPGTVDFFQDFFGIDGSKLSQEEDINSLYLLNNLDTKLNEKQINITDSISVLEDIYKKYDTSSSDTIVNLFNSNLEEYYNNRGRILLYEQKNSGDTSTTGQSKVANKVVDGNNQVDSESESNGANFHHEEYKYLNYNNLAEKITNKYILYRFKITYNTILIGIIKSGCFYIDQKTKQVYKLKYKTDDSLGNKYHKDFKITEAKGDTITEITQEQKEDSVDDSESLSEEITEQEYIDMYKKIFEMEEGGEDKVNYYNNTGRLNLLEASGNGPAFTVFKNKLDSFHKQNSDIDIKELAYYLPFFKNIDDFNENLSLLDKKGDRTILIDFPIEGDQTSSIEQNEIFTTLEKDIYNSSINTGLCYCNICNQHKIFIDFTKEKIKKIKSGDLFDKIQRQGNISGDCINYIGDKLSDKLDLRNTNRKNRIKQLLEKFLENASDIPEGSTGEKNLLYLLKESHNKKGFPFDEFYDYGETLNIDSNWDEFKKSVKLTETGRKNISSFFDNITETKRNISEIFMDFFYKFNMNRWFSGHGDRKKELKIIIDDYVTENNEFLNISEQEDRYETREIEGNEIDRKINELRDAHSKLKIERIKKEYSKEKDELEGKLNEAISDSEKFKESIMAMSALVKENDLELEKMELRALENENDEARIKIEKINNDINTLVSKQSHKVLEKDTSDTLSKLSMGLRKSNSINKYYERKEKEKQMKEKKAQIDRRRNIRRGKTKRRSLRERWGY